MKNTAIVLILLFSVFMLISCGACKCSQCQDVRTVPASGLQKTVSVSGSGIVNMKADMVSFCIGISEKADTTGEAQQKANAKVAQTLAIIRDFSIPDEDISTASISFNTEYRWDEGRQIRVGEVVSQTVIVTMRSISDFGNLVDKLGSSVSGISFDNVSFSSSDMSGAKIQAREKAYDDALAKAQTYADRSGLKIAGPISITEGSYSSHSVRTANDGLMLAKAAALESEFYETDAPAGLLSVSVNINAVFELTE